jgi:tRNA threonylcarbamoyl adenosine modification protein YjeE
MSTGITRFVTRSPEETTELATQIGTRLRPGDTVLLEGDIGAGKTHFARSLIQSLQDVPEDVPSPTFTLIQTYDTRSGPIWHADLYRLSGPEDIVETGLLDAMDTAICLIEWPDRLGPDCPANALTLSFAPGLDDAAREITATCDLPDPWASRLETCHV